MIAFRKTLLLSVLSMLIGVTGCVPEAKVKRDLANAEDSDNSDKIEDFWSSYKNGDSVIIPKNLTVTYDETAPTSFNSLTIKGTLLVDQDIVSLNANSILVEGNLTIGDEQQQNNIAANIAVAGSITIASNARVTVGKKSVNLSADSMLIDGEIQIGHTSIPSNNLTSISLTNGMMINGSLIVGQQDFRLTVDWIMNHGKLGIGSSSTPYTKNAIITFTGDESQDIMEMGTRGLLIMSGVLDLHGIAPQKPWTRITNHINSGSTQMSVEDGSGWKAGDQIVLAPTDFYSVGGSQLLTLSGANATQLTTSQQVQKFRWGLKQYVTNSGMSLTPDNTFQAPSIVGPTPTVLDQRAEIGNLSRNIIIQSVDDQAWQNSGFGAQVMIMNLDSVIRVNGVEFRRVGQAGKMGRYPIHWHRVSYPDGKTEVGDVVGHYIQNSTIHNSTNRCVTIHATNGVRFENNICYNILGHAIFFEDAVERRNIVENNLVLGVRFPTEANALLRHDRVNGGASGIWITNPDNTIRNNVFADAQGFGMWMGFPISPQGLSKEVPIIPRIIPLGNFDNNTVHSNDARGVMFDNPPIDDLGNTFPLEYTPLTNEADPDCSLDGNKATIIKGWKLWKNDGGNFWDRLACGSFIEFTSADGVGKYFAGGGRAGIIARSLVVGKSLNDLSVQPNQWLGPKVAFATYHSAFKIFENIVVNFPAVDKQTSGAFATDDYYTRPVELGMKDNIRNTLINSHGGYRSEAAVNENIVGNFANGDTQFVFAGALWDEFGIWGHPKKWNVFNKPFFTHNNTCFDPTPLVQSVVHCDSSYYGIKSFVLDQNNSVYKPEMELHVDRFDEQSPESIVGNWHIDGNEQEKTLLLGMRHFAALKDGIYLLDFPSSPIPKDVTFQVTNMHKAEDSVVIGVRYSGTQVARVYSSTVGHPGNLPTEYANSASTSSKHNYVGVGSKQAVLDSSNEVFWQDTVNNIVWIRLKLNGLVQAQAAYVDRTLYNEFTIRIW